MFVFASTSLASIFLWLWLVWGLLFAIVEGTALYMRRYYSDQNHNGGTLSELVWRTIRGYQWYHRLAFVLFIIFWSWLSYHFLVMG